jgi:CBS domain-containing protein
MEVRELIGRPPVRCSADANLRQAAIIMDTGDVGSVVVGHTDTLEGILTERDLLRAAAHGADLERETVEAWMTPAPDTVEADLEVSEAAMWMAATGYRHLPITDGDKLVGVASVKDVLWALTEQLAED